MSNGTTDIIIKSGSAEVVFDGSVFVQDPNDPKRHQNHNRKITRVVITGGISFDSGEHPNGLTCNITATCS
jgi:hypothetical protein